MNNLITNNSMMIMNKKRKKTQGRKKIEIKKIDKVSNRQVTFSKRRNGLFKKASEFCILTGAEVAIMVQSSGKRLFTFGHPSVDGLIDRYVNGSSSSSSTSISSRRVSNSNNTTNPTPISAAEINAHDADYARLCQELEIEKKKLEQQEKANSKNFGSNDYWWDKPIENMGLEELEQYALALEELKKNVLTSADELALLKKSHNVGIMNVDLNQITTTTSNSIGGGAAGCEVDLNFNQQVSSSANSILSYGFGI
ncbi:OLC1v1005883C1 [Oldenlandia corymbosa var. corymbosa]|uniref:OLC1v1005883C1 n=1 Tax=Oldenlandia corymbosa var. corymbosa TaxID=529605 RepID=A0AAV1DFM6_OLDCO|nr:OLC1v1005883C1 [Oldenlandia corymbosa var. corymbosa]